MQPEQRRSLSPHDDLLATAAGVSTLLLPGRGRADTKLPLTPSAELGPFHSLDIPSDTDEDLTRIKSKSGRALGPLIEVSGRVLTADGMPQPNARIELWQANAAGRYTHVNDARPDSRSTPTSKATPISAPTRKATTAS